MKMTPLHVQYPSTTHRYPFQLMHDDTTVNSLGSVRINKSYRDVNNPIHVEPAAKLFLSPDALAVLTNPPKGK